MIHILSAANYKRPLSFFKISSVCQITTSSWLDFLKNSTIALYFCITGLLRKMTCKNTRWTYISIILILSVLSTSPFKAHVWITEVTVILELTCPKFKVSFSLWNSLKMSSSLLLILNGIPITFYISIQTKSDY